MRLNGCVFFGAARVHVSLSLWKKEEEIGHKREHASANSDIMMKEEREHDDEGVWGGNMAAHVQQLKLPQERSCCCSAAAPKKKKTTGSSSSRSRREEEEGGGRASSSKKKKRRTAGGGRKEWRTAAREGLAAVDRALVLAAVANPEAEAVGVALARLRARGGAPPPPIRLVRCAPWRASGRP